MFIHAEQMPIEIKQNYTPDWTTSVNMATFVVLWS